MWITYSLSSRRKLTITRYSVVSLFKGVFFFSFSQPLRWRETTVFAYGDWKLFWWWAVWKYKIIDHLMEAVQPSGRALVLLSDGVRFKPFTLILNWFVLGCPVFNSLAAFVYSQQVNLLLVRFSKALVSDLLVLTLWNSIRGSWWIKYICIQTHV